MEHIDKKSKIQDNEISSTSMDTQGTPQAKGGSEMATQGYRGAFVGETMDHPAYNEKHKEQIHITTRTVETRNFMWATFGFNQYGDNTFNPQQIGQDPIHWIDDVLLTLPLNMYAGQFVDYKMLNLCARPNAAGYSKWKLNRVRVSIKFTHRQGGWFQKFKGYRVSSNETIEIDQDEQSNPGNVNIVSQDEIPLGMWVYRDKYDEYSNGVSNIEPVPISSTGGGTVSNTVGYRTKKFVVNEIASLTHVKPGEKFFFQREIGAKGAYYMSVPQIDANFKKYPIFGSPNHYQNNDVNLQTVINQLEGLNPLGTAVSTPLPEGFNLLLCPDNVPWMVVRENGGKVGCQPNIYTTAYIKYEADWFGYDFSYGANIPVRGMVDYTIPDRSLDFQEANNIGEAEYGRDVYLDKIKQLKKKSTKQAKKSIGAIAPKDSDFIKY